jgi:predicted nucleotidyltransferase
MSKPVWVSTTSLATSAKPYSGWPNSMVHLMSVCLAASRGEARPDSDIDLLVSFREEASLYDVSGLWQDLQDLLGHSVDLLTDDPHPRREHLMRRVLKEAVAL